MKIDKSKLKKIVVCVATAIGTAFVGLILLAKIKRKSSTYETEQKEKNPMEGKQVVFVQNDDDKENADGVRGHLEAVGGSQRKQGIYDKYVKRMIDIMLSFGGLIVLSPVFAVIALAIVIEDPGPVLFSQKRIGKNKQFFKLHKFRSMKVSTPRDVPTHMLENPDQYITKVGKFIRAHSLDELPQIWDIFVGNMSVIGPRPALWNQDVLIAERDKYGANDVKPGLTGWAQINGRDELEIPVKAKLDGEYVEKESLLFDVKCFLGTVGKVAKDDSVVEGGTGEMAKVGRQYMNGKTDKEIIGNIGFGEAVIVNRDKKIRVLITGANSYIGDSFCSYASTKYPKIEIDTLDMIDGSWREKKFSEYDIVYHVAGIAHADVGNVDESTKAKYYEINTDLAVEVCKKAKIDGVKEFIFMSSMIVYGDSVPYGKHKVVGEHTVPVAANFYGDSKLQADVAVRNLADDKFKVIVLRPPMIYGKNSKGNYPVLAKLAKKMPVFPDVDNERSMLHIDNLCEFLCQIMLIENVNQNATVLIPQNAEWTKTSEMVKEIARTSGKKIRLIRVMKMIVIVGSKVPGKIGELVNKAFGNSVYEHNMSRYDGIEYQQVSLAESIARTEGSRGFSDKEEPIEKCHDKPRALMLASVASMIDQFNMENIRILLRLGYEVDVIANFEKPGNISRKKSIELKKILQNSGIGVYNVEIPRSISCIKDILISYKKIQNICFEKKYDMIHCHSPIGGVLARLAAKKIRGDGCKVIYTAHGFHFYEGGSKKSWMVFYPIEKICSHFTDVLITINEEDYKIAERKFKAGKVVKIPGVGINTEKFKKFMGVNEIIEKRKEIGVSKDAIMILSVGELNTNKNHQLIIRAIAGLDNKKIHYVIVGVGSKRGELEKLAEELEVNNRVHFLGYRKDIVELNNCADLFAFPSIREGLGMASLEALSCEVPVVGMNTRGIKEYVIEGVTGYLFENDVNDCKRAIVLAIKMLKNKDLVGKKCREISLKYSIDKTNGIMLEVYRKIINNSK
ncbi:sugar transferase [Faecalicatena sp. Marseille-Q4148]|nr:sugar transferase [Faecalicatena sp. Marseille-Q4148]